MREVSSQLGPYKIVASLGAGGMGEVYRARDTRLGRDVAVKVLREPFAGNPNRLARFEREARAVAALSHPNILAIHDYGTHDGITYLVMELLEGETLGTRLARGPLPWPEAVEIGASVAEGLSAAHAKGIIHRDLKPDNLFVTADGWVKVLDFGLARVEAPPGEQSATFPYLPEVTEAGTVMGTVGYMSPEQVRGQTVDARTDLFSLGCVLYEMVTGRRAFHRDTAAETMTAILHDEPPDPTTDSGNQIPTELGSLIRHCLAKEPSQRFQSARDLALGLRATTTDPGHPRPVVTRPRPRSVVTVIVALLLIGVIVTSAYLLTPRDKPSDPDKPAKESRAIEALAILPFVYNGDDAKTEMLSQTLAGHIIDSFGQVRRSDLKIRPFSSVARYSRQRPDNPTIGRALNVPLIVTGTMQQRGDDLTITVEVVDAREDNLLWSKHYAARRGETLGLDLQDRLVRDVAANLGFQLSDEDERRLTRRRTADCEAYSLYREGLYHWNKFTEAELETAKAYFERAVKKDPNYALAYAGLARCDLSLGAVHQGPRETFPEARRYLAKALAIDDTLPDARLGMGAIFLFYDWDWPAAGRELKQAMTLTSSFPYGNLYGCYLGAMGRPEEALVPIERTVEMDPLAAGRRSDLAMCYNWLGQHKQAIAQAEKALELDPNYPLACFELGLAHVKSEMHEKAIVELQDALNRGQKHPRVKGLLGYAYAVSGSRAEAQAVLEEMKGLSTGRFGFALPIARIHAALGENDQAFEWLKKACDERDSAVIWIKVDATLDSVRSDPRFAEVLKEMGLPSGA